MLALLSLTYCLPILTDFISFVNSLVFLLESLKRQFDLLDCHAARKAARNDGEV